MSDLPPGLPWPDDAEQVRRRVYAVLSAESRSPSLGELARLTGSPVSEVRASLGRLAGHHAVVLGPDGDAVRMAHPFSAAPMGFVVRPLDRHDERLWWGGCAWDSFGISAATGTVVTITTRCPACGADRDVTAGPSRPPDSTAVVHYLRPARDWWPDVVRTCSNIRLYCSRDHVEDRASATGTAVGAIVSIDRVWELARGWYGDRLAADFRPHTREHNQGLLDAVGLTGDFWRLP